MKKILFVYDHLYTGGVTTYLLELLGSIDAKKHQVTLMVKSAKEEMLKRIPEDIHVVYLPDIPRWKKALLFAFCGGFFATIRVLSRRIFGNKKKGADGLSAQKLQMINAKHSSSHIEHYDIAVGADLYWSIYYTALKINADKKLFWIHPQYNAIGNNAKIDERILEKADKIFAVSNRNAEILKEYFPSLVGRIDYFENILNPENVKARASAEECPFDKGAFDIVTVCRLDNSSKRIDRCVRCAEILRDMGLSFVWRIIGEGVDRPYIEGLIAQSGLGDRMLLLGERTNPHPFVKSSDAFVLLSRYEGVPLVVTEAMILGTPVVVSNYESARMQVPENCGVVVDNNDTGAPEQAAMALCEMAKSPERIHYVHSNERSLVKLQMLLEQ